MIKETDVNKIPGRVVGEAYLNGSGADVPSNCAFARCVPRGDGPSTRHKVTFYAAGLPPAMMDGKSVYHIHGAKRMRARDGRIEAYNMGITNSQLAMDWRGATHADPRKRYDQNGCGLRF